MGTSSESSDSSLRSSRTARGHSPSEKHRRSRSQSSSRHRRISRGRRRPSCSTSQSSSERHSSCHRRTSHERRNSSHIKRSRERNKSPDHSKPSRERKKSPDHNKSSRERRKYPGYRESSSERRNSPRYRNGSRERRKSPRYRNGSRERRKSPRYRNGSRERRESPRYRKDSRERRKSPGHNKTSCERRKSPGYRKSSRERLKSPGDGRTSRERMKSPGYRTSIGPGRSDGRGSLDCRVSRGTAGPFSRAGPVERDSPRTGPEEGRTGGTTPRHNSDSARQKKRRKQRKHSSSGSSDSSGSSGSSSRSSASPAALLARLQEERARKQEERRRQKQLMKSMETPEQKRARRLQKKVEKERWRKQKLGWDQEYLHYTNEDNPFGDANLLDTFRWEKKLVKEGIDHIDDDQLSRLNRAKMEENKRELEKVKARRIQREQEMEEREREMTLQRSRQEAEQFRAWEQQNEQFHLRQCSLRSKIRIQEGRAKPIDLLAQYISSSSDQTDQVEVHEPYHYLLGLSAADLDDLLADIRVYERQELQEGHRQYWRDITIVVQHELQQLQQRGQQDSGQDGEGNREQIHSGVSAEIESILRGKSADQLAMMQEQIENKLKSSLDGVDVGYWERLLSKLKAYAARARLRDQHQFHLRQKLRLLKESQGVRDVQNEEQKSPQDTNRASPSADAADGSSAPEPDTAEDLLDSALREYRAGCYTPPLIDPGDLEPATLLTDPAEDTHRLEDARQTVLERGVVESAMTSEEKALQREASKGMEGDEAKFSVEADIGPQHHLWSDKYRPRKPRYFNRVHTGFDWNKYNQTHYDMDNPPPKVVQGYKFNIFYPDLIDRSSTPEYTLTVCEEKKDFCILRFRAGPPYQDIAFTIVNREWEYSYRHGFRCQFHNNVFQLWFHFKRYRYRR